MRTDDLLCRLSAADQRGGRARRHRRPGPGPAELFLYMYVRKEAVLSSQIEGTQSSLSDLLRFESGRSPGAPFDDVAEVSNYVAAMEHGVERLATASRSRSA